MIIYDIITLVIYFSSWQEYMINRLCASHSPDRLKKRNLERYNWASQKSLRTLSYATETITYINQQTEQPTNPTYQSIELPM